MLTRRFLKHVFLQYRSIFPFSKKGHWFHFFYFFVAMLVPLSSVGQTLGINYQGRILNKAGLPLQAEQVQFLVWISAPNPNCVLYSERLTVNMSSGTGEFSFILGRGIRADGSDIPFDQLFNPYLKFPKLRQCLDGYEKQPGDRLFFTVTFNDGNGFQALDPMEISPSPFALDTIRVAGLPSGNILRVDGGPASPLSPLRFQTLLDLIDGKSKLYAQTNPESGGKLLQEDIPTLTTPGKVSGDTIMSGTIGGTTAIRISGDIATTGNISADGQVSSGSISTPQIHLWNSGGTKRMTLSAPENLTDYELILPATKGDDGQVLTRDGDGNLKWTSPSGYGFISRIDTGTGLMGGPILSTGTISLADTTVTAATYGSSGKVGSFTVDKQGRITAAQEVVIDDTAKLPLAGGTMTGAISMGGFDLSSTGNITMGSGKYLLVSNNSADPTGLGIADTGRFWFDATNKKLKYFDGTTVQTVGAVGASLFTLNSQTGVTQSFGTPGVSGTAPNWVSNSNTHTLHIPMASSASVTAGLLSKTDYETFNAKQPAGNYITALTGDVTATGPAGGGSAASTLANVGTAGTYTKVTTDSKGRVTAGTSLAASDIPALDWAKITTGKPTTLTGYGITDGVRSVSGTSPISVATGTSTPVISIANAGTSSTGALTSTDWNNFNNKVSSQWVTSGTSIYYNGGNVGVGTIVPGTRLQVSGGDISMDNNQGLRWAANTDGAFIRFESTGDGGGLSKLILETTDNGDEPIVFRQQGNERLFVSANVGIGTSSPATKLHVNGTITASGVTGLSAPVNDSDAATKAYVDAKAGGGTAMSQTFNGNGTWTRPAGVTEVAILAVGGGGAGGGGLTSGNVYSGAGGGGGGIVWAPVVPVSGNLTITIGAGGTCTATNNWGGTGGNTTVVGGSISITAKGGGGGGPGSNSEPGSSGGGGSGTGGPGYNSYSNPVVRATAGKDSTNPYYGAGRGGGFICYYCGGGGGGSYGDGGTGGHVSNGYSAAANTGGGGGGAYAGYLGGSGGSGIVIIFWRQ